jgi:hypothetical protein
VIAPIEVADLTQTLACALNVGKVETDEIRSNKGPQSEGLALKAHPGCQPLQAIVCRVSEEGEAILGLEVAGDPRRVEGLGQWNGDMGEFSAIFMCRSSVGSGDGFWGVLSQCRRRPCDQIAGRVPRRHVLPDSWEVCRRASS